jgi:hypothetical protein
VLSPEGPTTAGGFLEARLAAICSEPSGKPVGHQ